MPHLKTEDDPLFEDFAELFAACLQGLGVGPDALQIFDFAEETFLVREELVVCFAHSGIEVGGQHCAPHLAATVHLRGAERTVFGDVDGGYDDFALARLCDRAAGDAEPRPYRRVLLSFDTQAYFADALCPDCCRTFQDDAAADVRRHMRQALALVPRSLEWFHHCCHDCYRLVWSAIDRARLGLLEDAFQAWWTSEQAYNREGVPASRGLFIRILFESEKLAHREPRRRLEMCRRAGEVARELGNADLENLARIYEGNALRAVSEFHEARRVFGRVDTRSCLWLRAALLHRRGTLDTDDQYLETAVDRLRRAVGLLQELDPHIAALARMKLAEALKWQAGPQESLRTFEDSLRDVDRRRWPDAEDFIAVEHALHLIGAGELDRAERYLLQGAVDSLLNPNFAGAFGELRLAQGKIDDACHYLEESIVGMLEREKYDNAVALTLSLAETHARDGSLHQALNTAMTALSYSASRVRAKQALQAVRQLADYSGSVSELASILRKLAWQSGSALPPTPLARR